MIAELLGLESRSAGGSSFELPDSPVTAGAARAGLAGGMTRAGVEVTAEAAMTLPVVFACINLLSTTIGSLPRHVVRSKPDGSREYVDGPVSRLLRRPNTDEMLDHLTGGLYWSLMTAWCCGWGESFSEVEFTNSGNPMNLWPLQPWRVTPVVRKGRNGNRKVYQVALPGGATVDLEPRRVIHSIPFSLDGIRGASPLRLLRETIGTGLAITAFAGRFFGAGTNPSIVVRRPAAEGGVKLAPLDPPAEARFLQSLEERFSGLDKSMRAIMIQEGMSVDRLSMPLEDAQMVESTGMNGNQIAAAYMVPLVLVGLQNGGSRAMAEQEDRNFKELALLPRCTAFEESADIRLLPDSPADRVRFSLDGFLRVDIAKRTESYRTLVQTGVMMPDEARAYEDMPPLPDGLGRMPWVQGAMTPMRYASAPKADKNIKARSDKNASHRLKAFLPLFGRAVSQAVAREARALERAGEKAFRGSAPVKDLVEAYQELQPKVREQLRANVGPILETLSQLGLLSVDQEAVLQEVERVHFERSTSELQRGVVDMPSLQATLERWESERTSQEAGQLLKVLEMKKCFDDQ